MRKNRRKALAICLNKKEKITMTDLSPVYITDGSRRSCLEDFKRKGYIEPDKVGFKVNEHEAREALRA